LVIKIKTKIKMALKFKNPKQVCNNLNALRQVKEYKQSDCGMTKHFESDGGFDTNEEFLLSVAHLKEIAQMPEGSRKYQDMDYKMNTVEEAKIEIVDTVTEYFQDKLFEMICEEMSNRFVFQSQNYLTEAGYEMFEDEWFEFYHEHHGEILYKVMKNIQNG